MSSRRRLAAVVGAAALAWTGPTSALAQNVVAMDYEAPNPHPAYAFGTGPTVAVDQAHHNFHTIDGRYAPFAAVLRQDGYRLVASDQPLSAGSLAGIDVLVIANALNARNEAQWSLPTPSAFADEEIAALRSWVEQGGSLFLIADHMPFPGAAGALAAAFGFTFSNGEATHRQYDRRTKAVFARGSGLKRGPITRGRHRDDAVDHVVTFRGSAFVAPQRARRVLVFGPEWVSHEVATAGEVVDTTPQVPIAGWCQGAILTLGRGRVAVFGEAAMFTSQRIGEDRWPAGFLAPDASQNHQFLLNILHWLTRSR